MVLATAAASPAIAAVASTSFPSLLQYHLPRSRRTVTTFAFARRFRGTNPSPFRSGSKAASPTPTRAPTPAPEDDLGALEAELWRLRRRVELRFQRLAAEADEAYNDLRSSVRVVGGDRVVLTFRRSSLRFAASALLWSLALSAAAWALLGLAFRAWRQLLGRSWWDEPEGGPVVTKRDRSLGGKEVVVAKSLSVVAPVSRVQEPVRKVRGREPQARLPEWWPEMGTEVVELGQEAEKWARLANRLVRAIIDNRIAGRDYRFDDAIQLRQLCKISGVKVSFDAENARDSFYRATTGFVLDDCSRTAEDMGAAQINGENPRNFLAGLAINIGLDKFRAATLVCASVAARTRACFLQCWALEIQGKRTEALDELVKISRIHNVFPPEENSAEMEMVAGGLKKNLEVAERVHLLSLYRSVCTAGNVQTAAEALGLLQGMAAMWRPRTSRVDEVGELQLHDGAASGRARLLPLPGLAEPDGRDDLTLLRVLELELRRGRELGLARRRNRPSRRRARGGDDELKPSEEGGEGGAGAREDPSQGRRTYKSTRRGGPPSPTATTSARWHAGTAAGTL